MIKKEWRKLCNCFIHCIVKILGSQIKKFGFYWTGGMLIFSKDVQFCLQEQLEKIFLIDLTQ